MLWNAQNGSITAGNTVTHYLTFGSGSKTLVMLPGLGDGLKTVRGMALPMAWMYRTLAKAFRVVMLSRKIPLEDCADTCTMAQDALKALDALGVQRFSLVGVSMGGMIAQHMAALAPERVEKLALVVTCPCPNPVLEDAIACWTDMAARGDHRALMVDNGRRIYSDGYVKRYGWMFPLAALFSKPRSYRQFLIMAQACRTHDAMAQLPLITVPTLVIGGAQDKCLGGDASRLLAERLPCSRLKLYPDYGHGCYEEATDFLQTLLEFFA